MHHNCAYKAASGLVGARARPLVLANTIIHPVVVNKAGTIWNPHSSFQGWCFMCEEMQPSPLNEVGPLVAFPIGRQRWLLLEPSQAENWTGCAFCSRAHHMCSGRMEHFLFLPAAHQSLRMSLSRSPVGGGDRHGPGTVLLVSQKPNFDGTVDRTIVR